MGAGCLRGWCGASPLAKGNSWEKRVAVSQYPTKLAVAGDELSSSEKEIEAGTNSTHDTCLQKHSRDFNPGRLVSEPLGLEQACMLLHVAARVGMC